VGDRHRISASGVTGLQSHDHVGQLRATVDVHIHYSFEPEGMGTQVTRWLMLDIRIPILFLPLRALITRSFDKENLRTMDAVKRYAEAHVSGT
jgi:hypothetical protein